jgi:hypothetical protein
VRWCSLRRRSGVKGYDTPAEGERDVAKKSLGKSSYTYSGIFNTLEKRRARKAMRCATWLSIRPSTAPDVDLELRKLDVEGSKTVSARNEPENQELVNRRRLPCDGVDESTCGSAV